mmetsp:Transcript_56811/g.149656  ORF Transcript_56811/g.149656 Transcript_56811/m.149656 type:complete len:263 (+) Transcript_56811:420-1208(+)
MVAAADPCSCKHTDWPHETLATRLTLTVGTSKGELDVCTPPTCTVTCAAAAMAARVVNVTEVLVDRENASPESAEAVLASRYANPGGSSTLTELPTVRDPRSVKVARTSASVDRKSRPVECLDASCTRSPDSVPACTCPRLMAGDDSTVAMLTHASQPVAPSRLHVKQAPGPTWPRVCTVAEAPPTDAGWTTPERLSATHARSVTAVPTRHTRNVSLDTAADSHGPLAPLTTTVALRTSKPDENWTCTPPSAGNGMPVRSWT